MMDQKEMPKSNDSMKGQDHEEMKKKHMKMMEDEMASHTKKHDTPQGK